MIPQYIVISLGGVMFSIQGLEFAYSAAPISMKSIVLAGWLLTTSLGNLIVVVIEALSFFQMAVSILRKNYGYVYTLFTDSQNKS